MAVCQIIYSLKDNYKDNYVYNVNVQFCVVFECEFSNDVIYNFTNDTFTMFLLAHLEYLYCYSWLFRKIFKDIYHELFCRITTL